MQQEYIISGHYLQHGQRGDLEGTLSIDSSNNIKGVIIDKLNPTPRPIQGKSYHFKDKTTLDFIVKVPDENLLDLQYSISKASSKASSESFSKSLEGTYSGTYHPLNRNLSFTVIGRYQLPSGDEAFLCTNIQGLVPRDEDRAPQPAQLILTKRI